MKTIVVLSGAGISAPSGIKTFRDADGLWENHRIEEVATPEAWHQNKELVLEFYNQRRLNVIASQPNAAHIFLAELEKDFNVQVVTQNVDDLHERGGSSNVLHLHGEIMYARSSKEDDGNYIPVKEDGLLELGELAPDGSQLRPHIVWFGEAVPMYEQAVKIMETADILLIIGTSLAVYPAAGLIHYVPSTCQVIIVDPNVSEISIPSHYHQISKSADEAVEDLKQLIVK